MKNPFEFRFPDQIDPNDVIDLFVPVFGEYYNVPISGHTFINGPRGSGKSMMLRYMRPDCQVLVDKEGVRLLEPRKIKDLDFFGIYVPIKKGHLNKTDIQLSRRHGEEVLNEHYMVVHFALKIFKELSLIPIDAIEENRLALVKFYNKVFSSCLWYSGYDEKVKIDEESSVDDVFFSMIETLKIISRDFQHGYLKLLYGTDTPQPYRGPLLTYPDFLYEILNSFRRLPFMPNKAIYLLIDDADELNVSQRKILNSWVSMRTTKEISLKISTQLKYKVFTTINDSRIDTPHDYTDVNINDIYTTKRDLYYKRVHEIVRKRLVKYNFSNTNPELFFPKDMDQEKKIDALKKKYEKEKQKEGLTKDQAYDFAYRYAVPDYRRGLKGNRYTYSYSGFKQLVNISSGIIREFIDFASEMYVSQFSENNGSPIDLIESSIQSRTVIQFSDDKMIKKFDAIRKEKQKEIDDIKKYNLIPNNQVKQIVDDEILRNMDKLRNLILGMGGLFRVILHSNTSERRVFSIALNDEPSAELRKVIELGVELGYLQKSLIGNKYGTGKSRLYVLNRVLAPHFGLDPSSFAGYKFMNSNILERALLDHRSFIKLFIANIKGAKDLDQTTLFNDIEF